jgi:PAS domain S-box-containing protein
MPDNRLPVVLTIDDEKAIRESFRNFLEDQDYEVFEAENGRIGLEVFREKAPDLVLVDLRMPEVDGLDVLASVRESSPDTPIIVISGTGVIGDAVEALRLGAWDYLLKPVGDLTVLGHAVDKALERARLIRENRRHQEHLEEQITERTAELKSTNIELRREIATREETEQRLADSETMLDSILRSVPDVIYRLDPTGRISFVNDAVRRYGYRPEDLIGKDALDIVHNIDRERVALNIRERRTGERRTSNLEVRLLGDTCGAACFEVRSKGVSMEPVFLVEAEGLYDTTGPSGGSFLGTQGIARDITERKQSEQRIRQNEEKHRTVIEASHDAIFMVSLDARVQDCNSTAREMYGYDKGEMVGTEFGRLVDGATVSRIMDIMAGRTSSGIFTADGSTRKDGAVFPVEVSVRATKLGEEKLVVVYVRDITERRQAEEALHRQSEALEQSLDGIAVTDLEGNLQFVNTAWASVHGYDVAELQGAHVSIFHTDEQMASQVNPFLETVLSKGGNNAEVGHVRKDGTEFPTRMSASVFRNSQGEPVGTVAIAHDFTEERELEEQLRQAQKVESIGRLAGGIAHDFNNLLSPILGYTEMLLLDISQDDPRREDLAEIHSAADRAKDLIRQLLAFSRKQVLEMKTVSMDRVVTGLERILRRTLREDVELHLSLASSTGAVRADVSQLEQILMNLGINAQDAMPNGGALTIQTSEEVVDEEFARTHASITPGRYEVLCVSDTGTGMSDDIIQHVFEPFFTTKAEGKGTGLGLATVYGIVKQHDGGIWLNSEIGVGTTFQIFFPRVEREAGKTGESEPELAVRIRGGSETILVVEDNDSVRSLVCSMLTSHGYTVLDAENPALCLSFLNEYDGRIDLLLTDVVMPGMNGRELYELLAPRLPSVKVLYMSGYTDDVIAHHGLLDDGVNFIQKPLSVQSLAGKVRDVLDG